ncbi:hypothetical protein V5799_030334 [Amblyomma americanum]|uniref:Peptidase M12B domain-containing protein n=1 Tax=Amblyomma americanum TaxID=6943 RepID=A0AAQ4ENH0_AMBAM
MPSEELFITSSKGIGSETLVLYGRDLETDLYLNRRHQSALAVKALGYGVEVRGLLTNKLRIAPVRVQWLDDANETSTSLESEEYVSSSTYDDDTDESMEEEECGSSSSSGDEYYQGIDDSPKDAHNETSSTNETFTVETCFVTSENYTKAFSTLEDLVTYLATMLNAVALRFLDMTRPMIRFQLNHVITNMSDEVILINTTNNQVDVNATLENMKLLSMKGVFNRCDIAVLLTSEDFVYVEDEEIGSRVDGMAFTGGVCGSEKVAVVEDTPLTYNGVHRLAHEIAHLLGASHDNQSASAKFPGYPGSESCPWNDGYLMSYCEGGRNKYTLSNCSREQIRFTYSNLSNHCTDVNEDAWLHK